MHANGQVGLLSLEDNTPVVVFPVCFDMIIEKTSLDCSSTQINSEKCLSMFFLPGMRHVYVCVCHCFVLGYFF